MAVATATFAPPPPPPSMTMNTTDKQPTYRRTRLASAATSASTATATPSPRKSPPGMQLNVNVNIGAHNLRVLKKAGTASYGNSPSGAPTPTSGASLSDTSHHQSNSNNTNNKNQRKYERKSKRFIWPDELHRLFVAAIFDVGLKNASPKALLSIMLSAGVVVELTTEHLKSHLQKYRLNYERSRLEFLEFYDESSRRSHKRRRKSTSGAAGVYSGSGSVTPTLQQQGRRGVGGGGGSSSNSDHINSAFVFPISHKRSRPDDDDDDDNDEEEEEEENTSEDGDDGSSGSGVATVENDSSTRVNEPPREPVPEPVAVASGAINCKPRREHVPSIKAERLSKPAAKTSKRESATSDVSASASQRSQQQRSQPQPALRPLHAAAPVTTNPSHATVSIAPFQPSLSYAQNATITTNATTTSSTASSALPSSLALPALSTSTLNDPQWNILNSLISPQLVAHRGSADAVVSSASSSDPVTSGAVAQGTAGSGVGGSMEPLSLHGSAPADLQMQMHLAMQAQMNLHRQMLTRKVEVSQHGLPSPQQQQQQEQQQQQQHRLQQTATWGNDASSQPPSQSQALPPQQLPMSELSSVQLLDNMMLAATPSADLLATQQLAYLGATSSSSLLGSQTTIADFAVDAAGALASFESAAASAAGSASTGGGDGDEDALVDLYRWDKMDFAMDIDDDDLFGFLKS